MFTEEERNPQFYKVKPQGTDKSSKESCLATRFTAQDATNAAWPSTDKNKTEAVRFEGEGYYSRLLLNDTTNCNETGEDL